MMLTKQIRKLTFKNNSPFRWCISKVNNKFIDNTEDLDTVLSAYNFLEHRNNYFMILGSFCGIIIEMK